MNAYIKDKLRGFRDGTQGSIAVEAVIAFPLLVWAFLAMWVYFDAFRAQHTNVKASFTIGDYISREQKEITDNYIDSMHNILSFVTRSNHTPRLRVSVVKWDDPTSTYELEWSKARGNWPAATQATINGFQQKIPVLPDQERVVIVETGTAYEPAFRIGLYPTSMEHFVVTSLRNGSGQLCFQSCEDA